MVISFAFEVILEMSEFRNPQEYCVIGLLYVNNQLLVLDDILCIIIVYSSRKRLRDQQKLLRQQKRNLQLLNHTV